MFVGASNVSSWSRCWWWWMLRIRLVLLQVSLIQSIGNQHLIAATPDPAKKSSTTPQKLNHRCFWCGFSFVKLFHLWNYQNIWNVFTANSLTQRVFCECFECECECFVLIFLTCGICRVTRSSKLRESLTVDLCCLISWASLRCKYGPVGET